MSYEPRDGDISLFKNDKKQSGSNQPDMRGKALINGQMFKISVWTKGTGLSKFLAGKIELDNYVKSDPVAYNPAHNEQIPGVTDDEGSLPF